MDDSPQVKAEEHHLPMDPGNTLIADAPLTRSQQPLEPPKETSVSISFETYKSQPPFHPSELDQEAPSAELDAADWLANFANFSSPHSSGADESSFVIHTSESVESKSHWESRSTKHMKEERSYRAPRNPNQSSTRQPSARLQHLSHSSFQFNSNSSQQSNYSSISGTDEISTWNESSSSTAQRSRVSRESSMAIDSSSSSSNVSTKASSSRTSSNSAYPYTRTTRSQTQKLKTTNLPKPTLNSHSSNNSNSLNNDHQHSFTQNPSIQNKSGMAGPMSPTASFLLRQPPSPWVDEPGTIPISSSAEFLETGAQQELLSTALHEDNLGLKQWTTYEWFYANIDQGWFGDGDFVSYLASLHLGQMRYASIGQWRKVRTAIGYPRRLSPKFLAEERARLEQHRIKARRRGGGMIEPEAIALGYSVHDEGHSAHPSNPKSSSLPLPSSSSSTTPSTTTSNTSSSALAQSLFERKQQHGTAASASHTSSSSSTFAVPLPHHHTGDIVCSDPTWVKDRSQFITKGAKCLVWLREYRSSKNVSSSYQYPCHRKTKRKGKNALSTAGEGAEGETRSHEEESEDDSTAMEVDGDDDCLIDDDAASRDYHHDHDPEASPDAAKKRSHHSWMETSVVPPADPRRRKSLKPDYLVSHVVQGKVLKCKKDHTYIVQLKKSLPDGNNIVTVSDQFIMSCDTNRLNRKRSAPLSFKVEATPVAKRFKLFEDDYGTISPSSSHDIASLSSSSLAPIGAPFNANFDYHTHHFHQPGVHNIPTTAPGTSTNDSLNLSIESLNDSIIQRDSSLNSSRHSADMEVASTTSAAPVSATNSYFLKMDSPVTTRGDFVLISAVTVLTDWKQVALETIHHLMRIYEWMKTNAPPSAPSNSTGSTTAPAPTGINVSINHDYEGDQPRTSSTEQTAPSHEQEPVTKSKSSMDVDAITGDAVEESKSTAIVNIPEQSILHVEELVPTPTVASPSKRSTRTSRSRYSKKDGKDSTSLDNDEDGNQHGNTIVMALRSHSHSSSRKRLFKTTEEVLERIRKTQNHIRKIDARLTELVPILSKRKRTVDATHQAAFHIRNATHLCYKLYSELLINYRHAMEERGTNVAHPESSITNPQASPSNYTKPLTPTQQTNTPPTESTVQSNSQPQKSESKEDVSSSDAPATKAIPSGNVGANITPDHDSVPDDFSTILESEIVFKTAGYRFDHYGMDYFDENSNDGEITKLLAGLSSPARNAEKKKQGNIAKPKEAIADTIKAATVERVANSVAVLSLMLDNSSAEMREESVSLIPSVISSYPQNHKLALEISGLCAALNKKILGVANSNQ